MKPLVVKESEIIRYATKNMVMNGSDAITSVAKAAELAALKARLMQKNQICKWIYKKVNGEIRVCTGILYHDMVKSMTIGGNIPKKCYGQFAYIELFPDGRMEWRSFREENFIGTIEN